jgi:hypothetical protein
MNPFNIKYGLIALDPENTDGESMLVVHFCGYESIPNLQDKEELIKELHEDEELGLTEIAHRLLIQSAPKDVLEFYIREWEKYLSENN